MAGCCCCACGLNSDLSFLRRQAGCILAWLCRVWWRLQRLVLRGCSCAFTQLQLPKLKGVVSWCRLDTQHVLQCLSTCIGLCAGASAGGLVRLVRCQLRVACTGHITQAVVCMYFRVLSFLSCQGVFLVTGSCSLQDC